MADVAIGRAGLPGPARRAAVLTPHAFHFGLCVAILAAACSPPAASTPQIRLDTVDAGQTVVEVAGLSRRDLAALSAANLTSDQWSALLRVTVKRSGLNPQNAATETLAVPGRYSVAGAVRFTPLYPLDPGREYEVAFDPARLSRPALAALPAARGIVALPAVAHPPSTTVDTLYPSGEEIPENQLRMYVQFSAPMGQQGGLDHVVLLDQEGREIDGALLPLDTGLWNTDRTRFTLIFDPGRVKREILPNRQMGRPLRAGQMITVVVKRDWLDAHAVPLQSEFRRAYRVGPADERPLDAAAWRITPPPSGTRDSLAVTFPEPLDRGPLERALGVERNGATIAGERHLAAGETRWIFTPQEPWQPGDYTIVVLPILEDLAGNRIGRAFEVRSPGGTVPDEGSQPLRLHFRTAAEPPTETRQDR